MGNCCIRDFEDHHSLVHHEVSIASSSSFCNEHNSVLVTTNQPRLLTNNNNKEGSLEASIPLVSPSNGSSQSDENTRKTIVYKYADFPFLVDERVGRWLASDRVMFIMRGIPGSGKTTLVDIMRHKYPARLTVCSVDQFWVQSDGSYKFDPNLMKQALNWCQNRAYTSCSSGAGPLVIDNAHLRSWEYRYYLDLANKFHYIVLLVTPRTPWRFDAEVLATKNKDNISLESMEDLIRAFEPSHPLYYGWFLSNTDSSHLAHLAIQTVRVLTNMPDFQQRFRPFVAATCPANSDLSEQWQPATTRLHIRSDTPPSSHVTENVGNLFNVQVIGLFLTPRTVGARCSLLPVSTVQKHKEEQLADDCVPHSVSSALHHILLASATDGNADVGNVSASRHSADVIAREDLTWLANKEMNIGTSEWDTCVEAGVVSGYGDGGFLIRFHTPFTMDTIFAGFY